MGKLFYIISIDSAKGVKEKEFFKVMGYVDEVLELVSRKTQISLSSYRQ